MAPEKGMATLRGSQTQRVRPFRFAAIWGHQHTFFNCHLSTTHVMLYRSWKSCLRTLSPCFSAFSESAKTRYLFVEGVNNCIILFTRTSAWLRARIDSCNLFSLSPTRIWCSPLSSGGFWVALRWHCDRLIHPEFSSKECAERVFSRHVSSTCKRAVLLAARSLMSHCFADFALIHGRRHPDVDGTNLQCRCGTLFTFQDVSPAIQ